MQNLTNTEITATETTVAANAVTPVQGEATGSVQTQEGGVAVMEATSTDTAMETILDNAVQDAVDATTPKDPEAPAPEALDVRKVIEYTREELLASRSYVLQVKRSGKNQGFGEKSGPMIRETIGYKFDAMDVMDALADMAKPDFLTRYKATVDKWYAGLKQDASPVTLKANALKHQDALALAADVTAFNKLVRALQVLCQRNQDWREKGNTISLTYNGHKAFLDFFGIAVTNNRRLGLVAN